jgi:hypothetical protein
MKRQIILTIAFLSIAIGFATAQGFTVTYLDGTLEIQSAGGWKALGVGGTVPPEARLRLSDSGTAELIQGAQHISIIKDGKYSVAQLLTNSSKTGSAGGGRLYCTQASFCCRRNRPDQPNNLIQLCSPTFQQTDYQGHVRAAFPSGILENPQPLRIQQK